MVERKGGVCRIIIIGTENIEGEALCSKFGKDRILNRVLHQSWRRQGGKKLVRVGRKEMVARKISNKDLVKKEKKK